MIARFAGWIDEVNTTSFRIVMSVGLACLGTLMILVAVLFFRWQPSEMQAKVLLYLGAGVMTMMGFDVAQFIGKRFSDAGYAAAKVQPAVNVEAPSTVRVDSSAGGSPPIAVGSPVSSASSAAAMPPVAEPPAREPEHGGDP